jgi:hypothetical protein
MKRMHFGRSKQDSICSTKRARSARNGNLENRVAKLEVWVLSVRDRLTRIETRLDYLEERIRKDMKSLIWRLVTFVCGFGTTLVVATYFVVLHTK